MLLRTGFDFFRETPGRSASFKRSDMKILSSVLRAIILIFAAVSINDVTGQFPEGESVQLGDVSHSINGNAMTISHGIAFYRVNGPPVVPAGL